ncbi:MAG: hypothetical protein AABY46_02875 [Nitrospirota bacterium]
MKRTVLLAFALYLVLFASFAVFHAYANNELGETTCTIGLWIQHGQTALLSVVLVSTVLASLFYSNPSIKASYVKSFRSTASLRAPPSSLL